MLVEPVNKTRRPSVCDHDMVPDINSISKGDRALGVLDGSVIWSSKLNMGISGCALQRDRTGSSS